MKSKMLHVITTIRSKVEIHSDDTMMNNTRHCRRFNKARDRHEITLPKSGIELRSNKNHKTTHVFDQREWNVLIN